ncbi:helix-turn-helix domain-containing protein [Paenibacillus sp. FA6]|uniref:helix-turn-helix domain-containing protein n=1 Tax=Paenibacillus sp. FA6 TaxID=3413029 RepID=UPI003F65EC3C
MKNDSDHSKQLSSYIYKLEHMKHIVSSNNVFQQDASLYALLLFKEATGDIVINGRRYSLSRQKVFIIPPDAAVKLNIQVNHLPDYYHIQFYALKAGDDRQFVTADLRCPDELMIHHFHLLIDRIHEIARKRNSEQPWDKMKANILFQDLLVVLFKEAVHEQKPEFNQAIDVTLDYIEQKYQFNITRETLAEISGLSADYFSRAFKKKVGKSPIEYLTEVRINHAKQLLILSNATLRSISHSVGFKDEFYFSRKFKAMTGRSPTSYVKEIKYSDKIASLKHLVTGHLIVLGIEPYAAVINNSYPVTIQFRNTIVIGDTNPDLEKLMIAKPDMIVTCEYRDFAKSQKEKMFDLIAPTITLPFFQDWRIHLQTIAKIVGKEQEAVDWLKRYENKSEALRKQIKSKVGNDTILIVGIGEGKMCVYGQRNIGAVVYDDLQLAVPYGVAEIAHYKEVSLDTLGEFDADRIILTSYRHHDHDTEAIDQMIHKEVSMLYANPKWRALKAVRNKAVYDMYESQHLYTCYTSLSHDLLLDKLVQLLMPDSSK